MRKTIISALIILVGLGVANVAKSLRHNAQSSDFFIPADAMRTAPQPEKLPDVRMMQYQGRQAPVIEQMEQERIAEVQQKQVQQKQKNDAERYEKIRAQKAAETQKRLQEIKDKTARVISENTAEPTAETKELTTKEENDFADIKVDENADIHIRIIQEYAADLNHISRGEPVENLRLKNMLADWNDEFHNVE